jgi:8-oxo-dGTP diphosphatase
MRPLGGAFAPHDEVDEIRWLSLGEADGALSYPRDREVLQAFADSVG